jgi:hypothetical protein
MLKAILLQSDTKKLNTLLFFNYVFNSVLYISLILKSPKIVILLVYIFFSNLVSG